MGPAPAFDCGDCGRRIGKTRTHLLLADDRVVCIRHYDTYYDTPAAPRFCSRAAAACLFGGLAVTGWVSSDGGL